jgi:hypothetical protein
MKYSLQETSNAQGGANPDVSPRRRCGDWVGHIHAGLEAALCFHIKNIDASAQRLSVSAKCAGTRMQLRDD